MTGGSVWDMLVRFWTAPVRAEPIALFRIVSALAILVGSLFGIAPSLGLYWGENGLIPGSVADGDLDRNGYISLLRGPVNIPILDGLVAHETLRSWAPAMNQPWVVKTLFAAWMTALVLLAVGLFTRTSAFVAWLLAMSFHHRAMTVLNGGDDVAVQLLFYLVIAPAGAAWSIDSLRRRMKTYQQPAAGFESPDPRPHDAPALVPPWSLRLIQIQLAFIYLSTVLSKMDPSWENDWLTGEAMYWVFNDVMLMRWPYAALPVPMWICRLLSWGTIAFELAFPFLIWWPRFRPWLLGVGVVFHLSIWTMMEIGWFGPYMLCYYPAFLSAPAVAGFVRWLAGGPAAAPYLVFYDTFCPICRRSRFFLEQFDLAERLSFRDIHDREQMSREAPGVSYRRALSEMIVRTPSGAIYGGFDAFRATARVLPGLWPLLPLLYVPGVRWVGRKLYGWIARNRYRLTKCDTGVCSLHLKALAAAELDEAEIARVVAEARRATGEKPK
jgi:predicted DCC family thiol-disulfide oxidoreductase YuxK